MQIENGRDYLSFVTEKLKERIRSLGFSLEEGEKDIDRNLSDLEQALT